MTPSILASFVQSFGVAPAGIVAVLSALVIIGLLAGVYQEVKLKGAARAQLRAVSPASYEIEQERLRKTPGEHVPS
jgi:hypothetical protein